MFGRCHFLRNVLRYAELSATTDKLNSLLDLRGREERVPRETIRQFIRTAVVPLLGSTTLDRRHDSSEMRRFMSQLFRDAAFAAVVLGARPNGPYVRCLVDCVRHDHERLQFIQRMTSSQASRVIEHLCRAGVRDSLVYGALVSRLSFDTLKDVARAMFALSEFGMDAEVVTLIVPLYTGEAWTLVHDNAIDSSNSNCNVFDAVRVLRALSRSARRVVEEQRRWRHMSSGTPPQPLPMESIQQLRSAIITFILTHANVLRGGHWVNVARAMVYFPSELHTLRQMEHHQQQQSQVIQSIQGEDPKANRQISVFSILGVSPGRSIDTDLIAVFALDQLFAPVERRTSPGRFDVASIDLVKVLPVIEQVISSQAVRQRRQGLIIATIRDDMNAFNLFALVRFLAALRRMEGSAEFAPSLRTAVAAISVRLDSQTTMNSLSHERLVQLATLLSAFRVHSCPGFVRYMALVAPCLGTLSVEDGAAFLSALATIASEDGATLCATTAEVILEKIGVDDANHETRIGDHPNKGIYDPPEETVINGALLLHYPIPSARLLRAVVLLGASPSPAVVSRFFGASGVLKPSNALRAAGGAVLFDVARSLSHFARVGPVGGDLEKTLWSRGVVGALLPLLAAATAERQGELLKVQQDIHSRNTRDHFSSEPLTVDLAENHRMRGVVYEPLAWRAALETVGRYVDVHLDALSLETMRHRVIEAFLPLSDLVKAALSVAAQQHRGPNAASLPFASNGVLHVVSLLLMLEHVVYHSAWQAETRGDAEAAAALCQTRDHYNALLHVPIPIGGGSHGTALQLLNDILPFKEDESREGGSTGTARWRLDRAAILEITTNLPFAVSLVVSSGPVNALFCERAVSVMIHTTDDA